MELNINKNLKQLKTTFVILFALLVLSFAACGSKSAGLDNNSYEVEGYKRTNGIIESTELEDGRVVDGHQIAFIKDTLSNAWFDFTVNGVEFVDEYNGIKPGDGHRFAVANITVGNTFGREGVDVYYNDFWLLYSINENGDGEFADEVGAYVDGVDIGNSFLLTATEDVEFLF